MDYVLPAPPQVSAAVAGANARYPVRRIFCVGKNYADHVREMGSDPRADPPVFFTKPADAVIDTGAEIPYPPNTANLHYEAELVVALARGGADIDAAAALDHVWGYAVGCDLTRRDRQGEAKNAGAPWDVAKAFDLSAPLGPLSPVAVCGHKRAGRLWLSVNGAIKQNADLQEMIWGVPEIFAALSRSWTLAAGDLIFTGTPAGVGPLARGDRVECGVEGLPALSFAIV